MTTPTADEPAPVEGSAIPVITVCLPDGREVRLRSTFTIGRADQATVRVEHERVSRLHAIVAWQNGIWTILDRASTFGLWVEGQAVTEASVGRRLTVQLGSGGPTIVLESESHEPPPAAVSSGEAGSSSGPTRSAFVAVLVTATLLLCGAGIYTHQVHKELERQRLAAEQMFYDIKDLELELARSAHASSTQRGKLAVLQSNYRTNARKHEGAVSDQDRLILRVTQLFGECELAAPAEYFDEINRYIKYWQSTPRLAAAVQRATKQGYTRTIAETLREYGLPAQFFYLALQESGFDPFASGPPTRFGIAKGMWQFVPPTAEQYGLTVGPLAHQRTADLKDDRHDWVKSTRAAAQYLKTIYTTDAQASGLLVMASYNWGEQRVIRLLKSMPANPRERNLWQVLRKHRAQLPKETYDYVFYIVSAAVIGENPKLFDFDFDNPLAPFDASLDDPAKP